jgi:hypothetical protein
MNNSSTDAHEMECRVRKVFFVKNFIYLGDLLRATVTLPSRFIEDDQLAASKISVTDFSLDSDTPFDADPPFFKPFPHGLMEEFFKDSSQLQDDICPPYDPASLAHIAEPLNVEAILDIYHGYVRAKWKESPSAPSLWQGRR